MLETRQKGEKTYPRAKFRWVFGESVEDFQKMLLTECLNYGNMYDERFRTSNQWTMYGPDGDTSFVYEIRRQDKRVARFTISFGCYQDGWHIKLIGKNGFDLSIEERKLIFNDTNFFSLWTQQTNLVPVMIDQLIERLEEVY